MAQSSNWYDAHAADLVHRYELVDPAKLYGWLSGLLSDATGAVLDVGAGSGRDAAWFAAQGHDVVAVEPSSAMRSEGQHRHPDPRVRWLDDQLPELSQTGPTGDQLRRRLAVGRRTACPPASQLTRKRRWLAERLRPQSTRFCATAISNRAGSLRRRSFSVKP